MYVTCKHLLATAGIAADEHPRIVLGDALELVAQLLHDDETDVKKAVSFAIRLAARGEIRPVRDFLVRNVPAKEPEAIWVLCDAIRSMTKAFVPEFLDLLPQYEKWRNDQSLTPAERRSIDSVIKTLKQVKG